MKNKLFQKVVCFILSVTTLLGLFAVTASAAELRGTNRDTASSLEEMKELVGVSTYEEYVEKNPKEYVVEGENGKNETLSYYDLDLPIISVDLSQMVAGSNGEIVSSSGACADYQTWENFGAENADKSVYLPEVGQTTWNFFVPDGAASYYYIRIQYFSCDTAASSISAIERKLLIDGTVPFKESSYITLNKSWAFDYIETTVEDTDEPDSVETYYDSESDDGYFRYVTVIKDGKKITKKYTINEDINGNSMLPIVEQNPNWNTYYCQDATGYHEGYFDFFILNGSHQLTLEAEREPVIIKSIELVPVGFADKSNPVYNEIGLPSYKDYIDELKNKGYQSASDGNIVKIEAEFPDLVSDSAVYPTNDNTSCATFPMESNAQMYNVIGENSYNTVGQWAAYKFTVNESGLYKLGMRYMQSALQGMYICRAIKLAGGDYGLNDGTPSAPFLEAYDTQFNYSKEWQSTYLGDSKGNTFEFYFEKGVEYTVYFECSLGSLKDLIQRVESTLNSINESYLRILQLTGSTPDEYRDYSFDLIMPDVLKNLLVQAQELMKVKEELIALCGTNGSHVATLETVAILLDTMGSDYGDNIAANMSNLKSYLGTLGTWINDSKKGTLIIDNIMVCPSGENEEVLPEAEAGFFESLWFEITSFIYSFFIDYEAMGLTVEPDENTTTVDVWLATGRDQSNIWRTMVDKTGGFTDSTGYGVTLKLVTGGTLLPSILAGKGPDIYMGLDSATVINYAIRDAVRRIGCTDKSKLTPEEAEVFNTTYYIYKDENGNFERSPEYDPSKNLSFVSKTFDDANSDNYVKAATDTLELLGNSYGVPQEMNFAMMFYRMDVLAELGQEVPETWDQLLAVLPTLQTNNMQIGVSYILALEFMLYQRGGSMWRYEDNELYAGAKIGLDSDIALEAFEFVCRLYTDYSFPVSYDASNRFRTGEMPIVIGDYIGTYNTLTVYATEIDGLWEFCPLPGSETGEVDENGKEIINYNSLASVNATVLLHGCDNLQAAWAYLQWQTSAEVQAEYGNKMVALIGPSAKYQAANKNAIRNLSWTASERAAIEDQMAHLSSIVNYPGSYIKDRYMKFAFLDAVNDSMPPVDALSAYISAINTEITRKREEFELPTLEADEEPPIESYNHN